MNEENLHRQTSIDFLKVLAIVLIVVFHFFYEFTYDNTLRLFGFVGISLFFIISGFLLAKHHPQTEHFSLRWFFSRYLRIAPLYYLALITMVLVFSRQILHASTLKNLVYHFLFIDFISAETAYALISPAWFLIPLMGLYLLFPYLNRVLKKIPPLLFLIFASVLVFRAHSGTLTSFSPLFFLGEFCFGIVVAHHRTHAMLASCVLMWFAAPVMIVPFLVFYVFFLADFCPLPQPVVSFVGTHTLAIFLFHESYIKVILGKWRVHELHPMFGVVVLALATFIALFLSRKIETFFGKKF